jgi:predicted nucleic acid-binding protein
MRVRNDLDGGEAIVPTIWPLEVLNAFLSAERQRRIGAADTRRFLALLAELPIVVAASEDVVRWSALAERARRHRLTAYDAAYLDLSLQLGLPLATLDGALRAAAKSAGVMIHDGSPNLA